MSDEQPILYTASQGVAIITLNRPDRRNAVTPTLLHELRTALDQAAADPAVRALLLTGAGKGFCAGQDLAAFGGMATADQVRTAVLENYKPVIMRLCSIEKPIIAAINGAAAGAGASLALACDLRIMADDATLVQAFSNIGLVPDAGSSWFLVRLVGYSRAFAIASAGERIPAQRCLELGLTNRVVAADTLAAAAQTWAQQLAQRPTLALGLTKRIMAQACDRDLETIIHLEAEMQTAAVLSHDHREGVTAFLEKRQPVFSGQ